MAFLAGWQGSWLVFLGHTVCFWKASETVWAQGPAALPGDQQPCCVSQHPYSGAANCLCLKTDLKCSKGKQGPALGKISETTGRSHLWADGFHSLLPASPAVGKT